MKVHDLTKYVPLIRALFYGDSGSGKTQLIGSAMECEETCPLLDLNAGGQPISLRRYDPPPLIVDMNDPADLNPFYSWFLDNQPRDPATSNKPQVIQYLMRWLDKYKFERFNSLAIDSTTHFQRVTIDMVVGAGTTLPGDIPAQTQIQHWGRTLAVMVNVADKFFKLPVHVFMTALSKRDTIASMGMVLHAPFLWGQSGLEVPSHAEIVGRLMATATIPLRDERTLERAMKERSRDMPYNILYMRGGRDYLAKWQGVTNPPSSIPAPTIAKIISIIAKG